MSAFREKQTCVRHFQAWNSLTTWFFCAQKKNLPSLVLVSGGRRGLNHSCPPTLKEAVSSSSAYIFLLTSDNSVK